MSTNFPTNSSSSPSSPCARLSSARMASRMLAVIGLILMLLLVTGCSTVGGAGPGFSAAAGASSASDQRLAPATVLAEAIIEGPSTNADGVAVIGREELVFVGKVSQDFRRIHTAATMNADDELAVIAAWALVCLAPEQEQHVGWQLLASTIETADGGLAVALAAHRQDFVRWLEDNQRRGLQVGSIAWRDACLRRATKVLGEASRQYDAAQGVFDDDEAEIAQAMIKAREGYDLMAPNGMSMSDSLAARHIVAACESDLWGSQAKSANNAYDNQVAHGQRRLAVMMRRLGSALEYTQHRTSPSYRQSDIESVSRGGGW